MPAENACNLAIAARRNCNTRHFCGGLASIAGDLPAYNRYPDIMDIRKYFCGKIFRLQKKWRFRPIDLIQMIAALKLRKA
jgi:hypothetical protein